MRITVNLAGLARALTFASLLLIFVVSASAQADNNSLSSDTISGHVDVPTGESLNAARAMAFPFNGGATRATAKVDSSGNFRLTGLQPGLYGVTVVVPGLIQAPNLSVESRRFYRPGDNVNFTLIKGGVITGKVTNAANVPMVVAPVRFLRVADAEGKRMPSPVALGETVTDDRGIYRRYGLPAGSYVVSAGGVSRGPGGPLVAMAYSDDLPTYAPSSTRETAAEFIVREGEEVTVDIQYRRERGHAISGMVAGMPESQSQSAFFATFISLVEVKTRMNLGGMGATTYTNYAFETSGLPDGEYELTAQQNELASEPVRVTLRGEDVSGITLSLHPLATIAGHVVFETDPKIDCAKRRATARQETIIAARRVTSAESAGRTTKEAEPTIPLLSTNMGRETGLDEKSDFTVKGLQKGTYLIIPQPPDPGWFVKSIEAGAKPATAKSSTNIPRDGLVIGAGEKVSNVSVTITDGAATLKGRVTLQKGERLPARLRFYLIPVEKESADNILRYFETGVQRDGSFSLVNIAPGRYLALTRPAEDADATSIKTIRRDAAFRAAVVKAATTLNRQITFKTCEQNSDFEFSLTSATSPQ